MASVDKIVEKMKNQPNGVRMSEADNACLKDMENKNVFYYMGLPYNYIIQPVNDESGHYFYGKVMELEGCQSTGDSFEEAYSSLREAMEGYIETKLENRINIPEPVRNSDFSGKFIVRIPKTLHHRLVVEAEREGVSLNQYALYKLSL